jgi:hypothetical protein
MGDFATPQALLHRWEEMQHDPSLHALPYKIELNAWGKVEMSPASVRHGQQQAALAEAFRQQLAHGPRPAAPESCIEVIAPPNVAAEIMEKTRAYVAEKPTSAFPISVSLPDLTKGYP